VFVSVDWKDQVFIPDNSFRLTRYGPDAEDAFQEVSADWKVIEQVLIAHKGSPRKVYGAPNSAEYAFGCLGYSCTYLENNEPSGTLLVNYFFEDGKGFEFFGPHAEKGEAREKLQPG